MFSFPGIFFRLSPSSLLFIIFAIGLKSPAPKPVPAQSTAKGVEGGNDTSLLTMQIASDY